MEPGSHKLYHVHGFHSRDFLDTYCSGKADMAFAHAGLRYPMEKFHNAFSSGDFKGDVLIDFSIGPIIHHLYEAQKYFRDIILLKPTEHCIIEVKKWMNSRTGAFDWSHASTFATEMAGNSEQCEEKEVGLRAAITLVVKFDLNLENLTDPIVLPQADCMVFSCVLEAISKDLDDFVKNFRKFSKLLKPANIKGGTLIDISFGPIFFHLYSACEYFKEIILLRFNDHCIIELKKWLHDRTGAHDWTHTLSFVAEKEGISELSEEKDLRLKAAIKHVLKCYNDKENITDPLVLPPADCVLITHVLDGISKDEDDFIRNLQKFTKLLKPGGQLLLYGVLNATYYRVGKDKFHLFNYNENFIRKAIEQEGFVLNRCQVCPRKAESDLTDFKATIFVSARKN